jgi:hypothetical protein
MLFSACVRAWVGGRARAACGGGVQEATCGGSTRSSGSTRWGAFFAHQREVIFGFQINQEPRTVGDCTNPAASAVT